LDHAADEAGAKQAAKTDPADDCGTPQSAFLPVAMLRQRFQMVGIHRTA